MEASRILNLYQFTQLYKDITNQAAGVLAQSDTSEEAAESWRSLSSCQASLWMGRYFDTQLQHKHFGSCASNLNCKYLLVLDSCRALYPHKQEQTPSLAPRELQCTWVKSWNMVLPYLSFSLEISSSRNMVYAECPEWGNRRKRNQLQLQIQGVWQCLFKQILLLFHLNFLFLLHLACGSSHLLPLETHPLC